MKKPNAVNERIKRRYLGELKNAHGRSQATIDSIAKALARFEEYNKYRDFKAFHFEQAVAFKNHLAEQESRATGEKLSKATLNATLLQLKGFFQWLSREPGYKSRVRHGDADYFRLSDNDTRVATARRETPFPTIDQVKHVIAMMPANTEIERRNRAIIAFALLTGARDAAIVSFKLKDIDLARGSVHQDARHVRTKFAKTFVTFFFPVGTEVIDIVTDWVNYLQNGKLWGYNDPLFPATLITRGTDLRFQATGLNREHWSDAAPIRKIFRDAFEAAGLPYFNPHSLRKTLVQLGETLCQSPEDFKAWSQNLGHEAVLTTFYCYGNVPARRQGDIIRGLGKPDQSKLPGVQEIGSALAPELRRSESTSWQNTFDVEARRDFSSIQRREKA